MCLLSLFCKWESLFMAQIEMNTNNKLIQLAPQQQRQAFISAYLVVYGLETLLNLPSALLLQDDLDSSVAIHPLCLYVLFTHVFIHTFWHTHNRVFFLLMCFNALCLQNPSSKKVYLSGYGVELAIKSQEYKAKDDTQVQGKHTHKHKYCQCTHTHSKMVYSWRE